jgi:hypothetical protein
MTEEQLHNMQFITRREELGEGTETRLNASITFVEN